jgi:hypothetical protein
MASPELQRQLKRREEKYVELVSYVDHAREAGAFSGAKALILLAVKVGAKAPTPLEGICGTASDVRSVVLQLTAPIRRTPSSSFCPLALRVGGCRLAGRRCHLFP